MSFKVAIQGQQASFHDIAAKKHFGDNIEILPCDTFYDVFAAVKTGKAEKGLAAIENSLFGSINEVYDLLLKNNFWISGEIFLRVEQCLVGISGTKLSDIKEVHSHPVALAQCEQYLDEKLPEAQRFEHHDTAGSAADIKKWNDKTKVAIAGQAAAELYDLAVLARDIETNRQNYTRFVAIEKSERHIPGSNKTALVLTTGHKPGALYDALGAFAKRQINLTKLQSRPIIGQAWHYLFYVDVLESIDSPNLKSALQELKKQNCEIRVLGSFIAGRQ